MNTPFDGPIWLIGCGNMAGAMLARWLEAGLNPARVTVIRPSGRPAAEGVRVLTDIPQDDVPALVLLGVKPQKLNEVALSLAPAVGSGTVLVSILAGVELATLRARFPAAAGLARAMPNTPVRLGEGVVDLITDGPGRGFRPMLDALMAPLGHCEWFENEATFSLAGHVTGAGPAFLFRFIDAVGNAAEELGLPSDQARRLARHMVKGAATLAAASGEAPAELARRVASPGGTTEAGLKILDEPEGIRPLMLRTLAASRIRGEQLGAIAQKAAAEEAGTAPRSSPIQSCIDRGASEALTHMRGATTSPPDEGNLSMASIATPVFAINRNSNSASADERERQLLDPGFGRVFTDHMALIRYSSGRGWHDAQITAREAMRMDPSASVLHYAQEIFEGMKAYRRPGGGAALFRPEANAQRFRDSARRLAMPELPDELFLESVRLLVDVDREWIPQNEGGALYLRPFMFANEAFLGVRPAAEYLYVVLASSVGAYFNGSQSVSLWVTRDYIRAAPGGTGAAKCGGNYAASLAAQAEAIRQGCDQVVFLDAIERRWIEELGGMNIFFVFDDGSMVTPPLTGTILPGITRDSIIRLARDQGIDVREEPYSIQQWQADAESGRLTESFACGTAAVVTSIGSVRSADGAFSIGGQSIGPLTQRIRTALVGIQTGEVPDPYGWVEEIA